MSETTWTRLGSVGSDEGPIEVWSGDNGAISLEMLGMEFFLPADSAASLRELLDRAAMPGQPAAHAEVETVTTSPAISETDT